MMTGKDKEGGSPGRRSDRVIEYNGTIYPTRRALARHLAPIWDRPQTAIEQMLMVCDDDAAAAQARYEGKRTARASKRGEDRRPSVTKNMIKYMDEIFPSRIAAARYLAPLTGRSVSANEQLLQERRDDVAAVIRYCRHHPPRAPQPRRITIKYMDEIFPSRNALARHLASITGRSVGITLKMLETYNDDGARVLDQYPAQRKIPVIIDDKIYTSKAEYARALHRRYHVLFQTCVAWIHHHGAEQALERAKALARKRAARPKQDRSVVVFGWRWPSFSAMCRYYGVSVAGGRLADWEDHIFADKPACLFPPLAAKLALWWEAGYLDERNRFSPEAEAKRPHKDLPLNVEPEAVTDPMERSMIDALQPPEVMTIRRSCLKKLHEMMSSIR